MYRHLGRGSDRLKEASSRVVNYGCCACLLSFLKDGVYSLTNLNNNCTNIDYILKI